MLYCLLVFSGFSLIARGQVPAPTPPPMQFRTLGADCAPEGLNYQLGSNNVSIAVQEGARSAPYDYSGESPLVLFRLVPGSDGKPIHQNVASINLSQGGKYPLLVFFKGAKDPSVPLVSVLNEDARAFPADTWRVVNDSKSPLQVSFGGMTLDVPAFSSKDFKGKSEIMSVGITSLEPSGPYLAMNSNVGLLPGKRIMFLVLPSTQPGEYIHIQKHLDTPPLP